jgi:hypothetical protein
MAMYFAAVAISPEFAATAVPSATGSAIAAVTSHGNASTAIRAAFVTLENLFMFSFI